jgi:hypothetical protein
MSKEYCVLTLGIRPSDPTRRNRETPLEITMYYRVLLKDQTVGIINDDTLDGQHPDAFVGERVNVHLHDENGNPIERQGTLVDVLEEDVQLNYQF